MMFARTRRLLLRPIWPEDKAHLARLQDDPVGAVATSIANESTGAAPASLLIMARSALRSIPVGLTGLDRARRDRVRFRCFEAAGFRTKGYATEAGRALIDAAALSLRQTHLVAGRFLDDLAMARLLEKLDFQATGTVLRRFDVRRGRLAPFVTYERLAIA